MKKRIDFFIYFKSLKRASSLTMHFFKVLFFVVCIGVGLLLLLSLVTYAVCLKINRFQTNFLHFLRLRKKPFRDMATELERRDQCYQKTKQSDSFDWIQVFWSLVLDIHTFGGQKPISKNLSTEIFYQILSCWFLKLNFKSLCKLQ